MNLEEINLYILESRKKNFSAEIRSLHDPLPGERLLAFTFNGTQEYAYGFLPSELKALHTLIGAELDRQQRQKAVEHGQ